MPAAIKSTGLIPVKVTLDWTDPDNAVQDVAAALELAFYGVFQIPCWDELTFTLVQLLGAPVPSGYACQKAVLVISAYMAGGTWSHEFVHIPDISTADKVSYVYIINVY